MRWAYFPDVDAGISLAQRVAVPELRYNCNGIEAGIFGKRSGDHLKCVRVRLEAVRLHALQQRRVLR